MLLDKECVSCFRQGSARGLGMGSSFDEGVQRLASGALQLRVSKGRMLMNKKLKIDKKMYQKRPTLSQHVAKRIPKWSQQGVKMSQRVNNTKSMSKKVANKRVRRRKRACDQQIINI